MTSLSSKPMMSKASCKREEIKLQTTAIKDACEHESHLGEAHLLLVVDSLDGELGLNLGPERGIEARHDLVEDVVGSLSGSLTHDTRLLEQV
ncbi:hypothetical protein PENTCL1PPCAC_1331 [Pristionchus entomophagus]|uniref:Uncharacterized protein n=1 Tax=Pristionchus entomophagus TaxID=358040 RepID=A0AAV5S881_9BILA|nr:hypothetical protein PENTCL1PPCAC_1331 [Pristionchus entomophagus]